MAKVTNPLFADFREAFADCIVFQNNGSSTPIARIKRRQAENPRSAHYPARIPGWSKALQMFASEEAPNDELVDYVAFYALSPDRPANLRTTALSPTPGHPETQDFTVEWDAPTTKYNGHPLQNLAGYFIEITQDFVTWRRLTFDLLTSNTYSGTAPIGDVWFLVLAVDSEGNVSTPSETAQLTAPIIPQTFDDFNFDDYYYTDEES